MGLLFRANLIYASIYATNTIYKFATSKRATQIRAIPASLVESRNKKANLLYNSVVISKKTILDGGGGI